MPEVLYRFFRFFSFFLTFYAGMQLFENRSLRVRRAGLFEVLLFAAELAICLVLSIANFNLIPFFPNDYLNYGLVSVLLTLFLFLVSTHTLPRKTYILVSAMISRQIGRCACNLLDILTGIGQSDYAVLINILLILTTYVPVFLTIGRKVRRDEYFEPQLSQTLIILGIIFFFFLGAYLEPVLRESGKVYEAFFILLEMLVCYSLLWNQYMVYRHTRDILVMQYESELRRARLEQYDQIQYIMEQMNIKSHDLKHQLRSLEEEGRLEPEAVDELKKVIGQYDTFVQTGNQLLDTILTQKKMLCDQEGIQLLCMLDGNGLEFLSATELRDLFGNVLDNAIEYLRRADNVDRYIKIRASRQEHFYKLTFENPCNEPIAYTSGGSVITKKKDQMEHGYGTKSILHIAEKHGGAARFTVRDGLFLTEVLFPVQ